jgi:hypothetical protein
MSDNVIMQEELAWRRREDTLEVQQEQKMARGLKEIKVEDLGSGGYLFLKKHHPSVPLASLTQPQRAANNWPFPAIM